MKKAQVDALPKPQEKILKDFHAETKADEKEGKRILVAKISTPNTDRSKDRVFPKGVVTDNYLKDPVVLFAHKYDELPIAKCTGLKVSDSGILATVEFPEEGKYEKSDIIYYMYKNGFLNAWSIGFMPIDYEGNEDGGYDFKSWEMFEFSSVPVPDNPEALTVIRSKGINVDAVLEKKVEIKEVSPESTEEKTVPSKAENSPETKSEEPKEEGKEAHVIDQPKEEQPVEETKEVETAEEKSEEPLYTDETKISDLTVAQLKGLITPAQIEKKDVSQVTSLAYILSDLSWLAYYFENSEVSQTTIDKIKQAISVLLEAIKEQAELGKKEVAITQEAFDKLTPEQKEAVKGILTKAGRTISAKNEEKLRSACDYLKQASAQVEEILGSLETTDEPKEEDEKAVPQNTFLLKLANSLKTNNQKQDLTLRLLKEIRSGKGGE